MGETITLERDEAVKDQLRDDVFAMEATDNEEVVEEQWGDELEALVRTNEEVIVICPWMDGAEVTLTTAMNTYDYGPNMTDADIPFVISIVNELLASRVIKPEEPEKQEKEGGEEPIELEDKKILQEKKAAPIKESHRKAEAETRKPQIKPTTAAPQPPEEIIVSPQDVKVSITREEKSGEPANESAEAAVAVIANSTHEKQVQPAPNSVASEYITSTDSPIPPEVLPATNSILETLEDGSVIVEAKIGAERQPEVLKITATETTIPFVIDERPVLIEPQLITDQKPEPSIGLSIAEAFESAEPLALPFLDYQMDTSSLIDFSDGEVVIDHFKEVDIRTLETTGYNADREKATTPQTGGELNVTEQEAVDLVQPVQANILDLPKTSHLLESARGDEQVTLSDEAVVIATSRAEKLVDRSYDEPEDAEILGEPSLMDEEIVSPLIQLAERIKASDSKTTEIANQSLDKIIETVAQLEIPGMDDIITEAKTEQELEELFTELFNVVGINHTPELISYLTRQTLAWHLADEIKKLQDEEEAEEASTGSATHAIIKKLIAALKTIKRATGHICAIGKTALVLYNFSFQFKLDESF